MQPSTLIYSKTKDENYLAYLIMELISVFIITGVLIGMIVFYAVGRSDARYNTNHSLLLFDHPKIYIFICVIPALIAMGLVVIFRNRNYVVGYRFNNELEILILSYRGLLKKENKTIEVLYSDLRVKDFKELNFLFNQANRGKRVIINKTQLRLDFVSNNFIWENQPREKVHFLRELRRLEKEFHPN